MSATLGTIGTYKQAAIRRAGATQAYWEYLAADEPLRGIIEVPTVGGVTGHTPLFPYPPGHHQRHRQPPEEQHKNKDQPPPDEDHLVDEYA
jgi:hypothetical protein